MDEKHQDAELAQPQKQRVSRSRYYHLFIAVFFLVGNAYFLTPSRGCHASANTCAQVPPLHPTSNDKLNSAESIITTADYKNKSIAFLSNAVKIPSISYDDLGAIGTDKRWEIFYDFATYLEQTFPKTHSTLQLEKVNTHGLLYTWQGTNVTLKPTLLMAHQDVVPVPDSTIASWTHPPFEGFFDGEYIWGRGSSDCKNQLIAILEVIEMLIGAEFAPQRTILVSFGFDEEVSGPQGAGHLAPFILERYGKDSIAVIVDEGSGASKSWGTEFMSPGVSEKGYLDVQIEIRMPGGHSSVPPPHTSIGVLAQLINLIEADTYDSVLDPSNPYLGHLSCGATHAPDFPKKLKKLLSKGGKKLVEEASKLNLFVKYLMTTSVAVDIIGGGVKVNALPESAIAVVNHRVNIGSTTVDVTKKLTKLAAKVAKKHNLTLHAFDGKSEPKSISLSVLHSLEPAPVTPTNVDEVTAYSVLSGTTRALFDVIVSPGLMTGNTDTKFYWELSQNIFRFNPARDKLEGLGNIHTVDEKASIDGHINGVQWFWKFIRNMDEAQMA